MSNTRTRFQDSPSDTKCHVIVVSIDLLSTYRYERGDTLAGVLYFHRISDLRMGGGLTRNFRMFRTLCGEAALKNVVIVTNMWGGVEPEVGYAREAELMREDIFFKPALENGARMVRHTNTVPSAEAIIRHFFDNQPLPLQIQRELIDERMDIVETGAGRELNRELNAQIRKHQEEVRAIAEEMEIAKNDKDEEARHELAIETKRMYEEIERFENEARRLASDYQREKTEFQARLVEMERERQEGYRASAELPRCLPRLGGRPVQSPPTTALYRSSLAFLPTTEVQLENGLSGGGLFSRDSWDISGVGGTAGTYLRDLF